MRADPTIRRLHRDGWLAAFGVGVLMVFYGGVSTVASTVSGSIGATAASLAVTGVGATVCWMATA